MRKIFAYSLLCLIVFSIFSGSSISFPKNLVQTPPSFFINAEDEEPLVIIHEINLEIKVNDKFVVLDELIPEVQNPEEGGTPPQIVNKSTIKVNATYSLSYGRSESIVIRQFAIDIYEVISGEQDKLNKTVGIVNYRYQSPEDLILKPNSSKSELVIVNSLSLPAYATYKFVFRVQYHIYKGEQLPKDSLFPQNMTFELIAAYPSPPYFILFIFYFVCVIFIALVVLGIYGNLRYKGTE